MKTYKFKIGSYDLDNEIQKEQTVQLEDYKEMQLEQGITFEQSRIKSLEGIKAKIEKRLE